MAKQMTAAQLMKQTPDEAKENDLTYKLEDAATDLQRAIEKGTQEVSKLGRTRDEQVKAYVLGGSLNDLLQYERDIRAKQDDVDILIAMQTERFPKKK